MRKVFAIADSILSPLGLSTAENFAAVAAGRSAITKIDDRDLYPDPFYAAKIVDPYVLESLLFEGHDQLTVLEKMMIKSLSRFSTFYTEIDLSRTMLIVASTKGNIDLLTAKNHGKFPEERVNLWAMAEVVNDYFRFPNRPLLVSNACISGVSALLLAKDLIAAGHFDHAVVCGGDLLSEFVISGFHAFKAISEKPCKPFDAARSGISLGEAVASVFLSKDAQLAPNEVLPICIAGGAESNDANHISGPARDGGGLKLAIDRALANAQKSNNDIDYINAHGTATIFNDEMEAIAFTDMGFGNTPANSLKGYFGHTLGAAGVLESIICMEQMRQNRLLASHGFGQSGTSKALKLIKTTADYSDINSVLKTNSGFGGCNAAIIFKKP